MFSTLSISVRNIYNKISNEIQAGLEIFLTIEKRDYLRIFFDLFYNTLNNLSII